MMFFRIFMAFLAVIQLAVLAPANVYFALTVDSIHWAHLAINLVFGLVAAFVASEA